MKNIEIEIRIKIKNPRKFLLWLKKSAKFIGSFEQLDVYFDPPDSSFIYKDNDGSKNADKWFRVRKTKNKSEICYKYWHKDKKTGKSTYADEIEVVVEGAQKTIKLFESMGFKETSVIKKKRESWKYGNFRFDCDKVEKLGFFVEIEYHGKIANPEKGKEKIFELLDKIGLKNWDKIKGGYPWLQWNPRVKHFEKL